LAIEKTVETLGERLAADSLRLSRGLASPPAWLDLLTPVIERTAALSQAVSRFERRDGLPARGAAPDPAEAAEEPVAPDEDGASLVWPGRAGAATTPGQPLAPDVRDRLRPLIGPEIERARMHTGAAADALARTQGADAVAVGADVHFRHGAFAPDTPAGLGLIAHELTHVAESQRPGVDWRRSTAAGVQAEEILAEARESSVAGPAPPAPRSPFAAAPPTRQPPPTSIVASAPAPQARPMKADTDRPAAAPIPAAPNLDQLRDGLYRDIMARIRVDFERGA